MTITGKGLLRCFSGAFDEVVKGVAKGVAFSGFVSVTLIFTGLMSGSVQAKDKKDAASNDVHPPGYSWQSCQTLNCFFLVPEGWTFESLSRSGVKGVTKYQMLPNRYKRKIPPRVNINILQHAKVKTGLSATRHIELFMDELSSSSRVLKTWKHRSGALVSAAATSLHFSSVPEPTKKFNLLIANEKTGTLYVFAFETHPGSWDGEWPVVEEIFSRLRLDERY